MCVHSMKCTASLGLFYFTYLSILVYPRAHDLVFLVLYGKHCESISAGNIDHVSDFRIWAPDRAMHRRFWGLPLAFRTKNSWDTESTVTGHAPNIDPGKGLLGSVVECCKRRRRSNEFEQKRVAIGRLLRRSFSCSGWGGQSLFLDLIKFFFICLSLSFDRNMDIGLRLVPDRSQSLANRRPNRNIICLWNRELKY